VLKIILRLASPCVVRRKEQLEVPSGRFKGAAAGRSAGVLLASDVMGTILRRSLIDVVDPRFVDVAALSPNVVGRQ